MIYRAKDGSESELSVNKSAKHQSGVADVAIEHCREEERAAIRAAVAPAIASVESARNAGQTSALMLDDIIDMLRKLGGGT